MNFGTAIECLKQGYAVARKGWIGKLYLTGGSIVDFQDLRGNAKRFVTKETTRADAACINPHIDMVAADGSVVVGWLASQTDMLAEDWEVVYGNIAQAFTYTEPKEE